jgi:hypothetical protein
MMRAMPGVTLMKHELEYSTVWWWTEGVCTACGTRAVVSGSWERLKRGFDKIECER